MIFAVFGGTHLDFVDVVDGVIELDRLAGGLLGLLGRPEGRGRRRLGGRPGPLVVRVVRAAARRGAAQQQGRLATRSGTTVSRPADGQTNSVS